jgi:transcriptional regulator with XRE-family HTH domain
MLNDALRLIREFHCVKQKTLAKGLSISTSYLSEIENGKKKANLELLEKYSEFFKVAPSSLLLFSEELGHNPTSDKIRFKAATKIIKIMNWITDREEK